MQLATPNNAQKKEDDGFSSAAVSAQEQLKLLEKSVLETKDSTREAIKKFDSFSKLEALGKSQPESEGKTAALKRLAEGKAELREKIDSQIKHLIKTAQSARELGEKFTEFVDLYNDIQKETQDLLRLLKERQVEPEKKVENAFAKINFRSSTINGEVFDSSQYLKLDNDGTLLVWTKSAGANDKWEWVRSDEHNKIPYSSKFACLYQQSDGSFVDSEGNTVSHLDSYSGKKTLAGLSDKIDTLEEGKISSLKNGAPSDLFYKGKRVVFTRALDTNKSGSSLEESNTADQTDRGQSDNKKENTVIDYQKVGFAVRACDGTRVQSAQYFKLDANGELLVWQRTGTGLSSNVKSDYSWQTSSESNAKPFRMKFKCLYQEADGSFTDSDGKKIAYLDTYQGRVPITSIQQKIETTREGIVSGLKSGSPHEYFHEGAQIVFTKRSSSVNVNESSVQNTSAAKTFRQINYDSIDNRGVGHKNTLYARTSAKNELEVYSGRDSSGKEIWLKEKESNFNALYIHNGKAFDSSGNEVNYLTTGAVNSGNKVSTQHLMKALSFDASGIGNLPENILKAHSLASKQVVFIKGPPPGFPAN